MSSGCVRLLLVHTVRGGCGCGTRAWGSRLHPGSSARSPLCSAATDAQATKKKPDPRAQATVGSVGRKIPHRVVRVIGETGDDLGAMHRADVVRVMDEQGLKLVLLSDSQDPPVYRLMSGKQIHEEQLRQREKQKAKAAPVQVKELAFSPGIASHDLATKLKQVESWLEKKHHVRLTLRSGRGDAAAAVPLDTALEQIVQQMEGTVGFVSKPQVIREGRAAMCVVRPPSAKELAQEKNRGQATGAAPDFASSGDGTVPKGGGDTGPK